jgi:hypothetical protein
MAPEIVTSAIIAAISAGAVAGVADTAKSAIADAYQGLKSLIKTKFGHDSEAAEAIDKLEAKPDSGARKEVLAEELKAVNSANDHELVSAAQALLALIKAQPESEKHIQVAQRTGIAQADRGSIATVNMSAPPPAPNIFTQTANAVTTQTVVNKIYTRERPKTTPPRPPDPIPRHNVKFIRLRSLPSMVVGEFRNLSTPNRPVASFRYVMAAVTFTDMQGAEVQYVSPSAWLDRDTDRIDLEPGGDAALVVLAAYSGQQLWVAPRFKRVIDTTLDVFGEERIDLEEWPLKTGVLQAEIVLVGENGISLPPETVGFELKPNGEYQIIKPSSQ